MRSAFDFYDIWMIREEFIPFAKKGGYSSDLKSTVEAKSHSSKCWPCYVVEELNESKFIYLFPMKNYGSLDTYFEQKSVDHQLREKSFVSYATNSLLRRLPECSYRPDESYEDWETTPYINYWVISVKYDGDDDFEAHLKALAQEHKKSASHLCFRSWRMTFGAELPKYVIVLYSKSKAELKVHSAKLDLLTSESRQVVRRVNVGKGFLRTDLKK